MHNEEITDDFIKEIYSKILPEDFQGKIYLDLNPDVAKANEDPLSHYLNYGIMENRIYKYQQIPKGASISQYTKWIEKKNSSREHDLPFKGFDISLPSQPQLQLQLQPQLPVSLPKQSDFIIYSEYKFLYYLAAIGSPNLEVKIHILNHNLNYLHENIGNKFDIMINCYDDDASPIEKALKVLPFLNKIIIYKKKGRLVELWKTNPYHNLIPNYDYILYVMDDIMISKLDMNEMISIKNTYDISFLSPQVLGGTWDYMRSQKDNQIAFVNTAEIFCLLFKPNDFYRFIDINDIENTHTWGIDFLLGHFKIKTAIHFKFIVNHILPSKTNGMVAQKEMETYFRKHGFTSIHHILGSYPTIYSTIEL